MLNQKQNKPLEAPKTEQLEETKTVEVPPIDETLEKVSLALKTAEKKLPRRHICYVCKSESCTYPHRIYPDTGERFTDHNLGNALRSS